MKKLGIIISVILLFAVAGLWYLGGTADGGASQNPTTNAPTTLDDKLIALVQNSRAQNGRPLLDPSAAKTKSASAFRLTLADLTIAKAKDDSAEATKRYGQSVSQIFQNASPRLASPGLELELALVAFKEQSPAKLAVVEQEAARYGRLATELEAMTVPDGLKNLHLNLLNAVLGLAEVNSYLAEILTEPIMALDLGQSFAGRYGNLVNATAILNQVLASYNLPLVASL